MAADAPAAELPAVRLGGVVHDGQATLARELEQRVDVGTLSVEVDGNECARARTASTRRRRGVERPPDRIDVGEHRRRPGGDDRGDRGHAGVRGRDHLVTGPDARRAQGELERVGARADCDGLAGAAPRGELLLEGRDLGAADEHAPVEDAPIRGVELAAQLLGLPPQVEEGNGQLAPSQ